MFANHFRPAAIGIFIFLAAVFACSQQQPCPRGEALINVSNPAYADAQAFARVLRDDGFVVRCIFPSKLGSMFEIDDGGVLRSTIEGEAVYLTNLGGMDVVFVPKPQTFSGFNIREKRQKQGHLYLLSGTPHVMNNQFGAAYPQYFLKRDNLLLIVSDKHLRDRLERMLNALPAN